MAHGESDLTPDPLHARLRAAAAGAGGGARRTPECPDPADIATLVTGDGEAAATFLSHASTCDYCGPQVDAAMGEMADRDEDRVLLDGLHTATPEWRRQMSFRLAAGKKAPATSRRWVWTAAGVAAAAALIVVAIRVASPDATRPELQDLVAALNAETQRPVDGRLTGGFSYAGPPTLLRGPTAEAAPRVRIAAAQLEEAARANDTAATQAAVGVGFLAVGELDKAVDALEGAVLQSPTDARYQSDLAAAYLARAKWTDRAEDWPKALAAAERAVKADPTLVEAQFNRALGLEGLHLIEEAIEAWSSYQSIETDSRWRDEADEHVRRLRERLAAPKPQSNQDLRERIEDELLAKWGAATLAGDAATASRFLGEAESAAAALVKAGGDTMARDEIVIVRRAAEARNQPALKALATGHVLFGRARREFTSNRFRQASELMTQASVQFEAVPTPYVHWGPIYRAMVLWVAGSANEALRELAAVPERNLPGTYYHVPGRFYWTRAVAQTMIGRFDTARDDLRLAVEAFHTGSEIENLSATQAGLAEAEWLLGEHSLMWKHEIAALSNLRFLGVSLRRNIVLLEAAIIALNTGLPETALHFQNSLVRSIETSQAIAGRPDAYMRRARIYAVLNDRQGALADLDLAETAAVQVEDAGLRARYVAEAQQVRAELSRDHATALEAANAALEYFERAGPPTRLAELLVRRAKIFEEQQNWPLTRRDLRAATDAFDRDRAALRTPLARVQAYERRRGAFKELVRFEVDVGGDLNEALQMAERARARSLVERFAGPGVSPIDPATAAADLRSDTAVVYYVVLDDRVLVWVITREGVSPFSSGFSRTELDADVRRLRRLVDQGASMSQLAPAARRMFDELVQPAITIAAEKGVLVFVPDGPLSLVPFATLPNRDGRPLIESHAIAMAPSLTSFLTSSRLLDPLSLEAVLAVGDGHDSAASGLAPLPMANDEAATISRLYSTGTLLAGAAATKHRFLMSPQSVIHFAGHAVLDPEFPMLSRLLLAPDHPRNDGGTLLADEIASHNFQGTQIVVLATCDAAAGRLIEGEGEISLARMFLEAGVPSVIASLWAVDESAKTLLVAFHHQLRLLRDPVLALQASQLSFLRERGAATPVRIWGGFVATGGMSSTATERVSANE